jgi:cytochrome c oxidase subunit II
MRQTFRPAAPEASPGPIPRWLRLPLLLVFGLVMAACAGEQYPQTTLDPVTDFGDQIHSLYVTVFWWTMLILVVVWVALFWILIKYRAREGAPTPKQIHGHLGLEIGWTIGPAIIVVLIAIPTIQTVFATQRPLSDDALEVHVTGFRYWWDFYYPEYDIRTANELHLPTGRAITLRLHSNDIIHSFWVPRLGGKRDLNPLVAVREGEPRYNYLYFTVNEPGVYMGQCAEFCGEAHAWMGMRVEAHAEGGFEGWIEDMRRVSDAATGPQAVLLPEGGTVLGASLLQEGALTEPQPTPQEDPLVTQGREVFLRQAYCTLCHAVQTPGPPTVPLGPNLARLGARGTLGAGLMENNEENLIRWIVDPQSMKPGVIMPGVNQGVVGRGGVEYPPTSLTDEQVRAVAVYLLSQK